MISQILVKMKKQTFIDTFSFFLLNSQTNVSQMTHDGGKGAYKKAHRDPRGPIDEPGNKANGVWGHHLSEHQRPSWILHHYSEPIAQCSLLIVYSTSYTKRNWYSIEGLQ